MRHRRLFFRDRLDAARQLADRLAAFRGQDAVVLALPRGGVPIGEVVARELGLPLDVVVVRKLGVPGQRELAMGAVGEDGVLVVNERVVRDARIAQGVLDDAAEQERAEVTRRAASFRQGGRREPVAGRVALLVDDGLATGSPMRAACQVVRAHGAGRVVVAVPVAAPTAARMLEDEADEVICLGTPRDFFGVGEWYGDFRQVPDDEVVRILTSATARGDAEEPRAVDRELEVSLDGVTLPGRLTVPAGALGLVVFAHGSGSSRLSPRNRAVADDLKVAGIGTLLVDLLTEREGADRGLVFDIALLARRLAGVADWATRQRDVAGLPLGYFGASTGAAAALVAATGPPAVSAVVSRGGRPDLAGPYLPRVAAPTLLIVGGADDVVLDLNREAQRSLECVNDLVVVPRATHLFEEPGGLEEVARLAADWFRRHLGDSRRPADRQTGPTNPDRPH